MNNYNEYLGRLKSKDNNIENYYYKELKGLAEGTILNHLISISKLFESEKQRSNSQRNLNKDFTLKNNNINQLTEQDIKDFLDSDWWNNLSGATQKGHVNKIGNYFKYSERKDLLELLPTKINGKSKELSKIDLISREDLNQVLKYSNLKYKTLFMILYEGALRIDEVLNIRWKDIKFNSGYTILKISESKTYGRDIPVIESTFYIKEYTGINDFEPDDKLFDFKYNNTVNNYLNVILKRLIKKYPKQWKGRKLYPHLLRHSRLTELARGKLNEAQIRKFAGWSADSSMAKVYFHLDDSDVINILTTDKVVKAPKPEPIEPKMCEICNTENNQQNLFCWRCGNVINEEDREKMGIEVIIQPHKVEELREENKELKQKLNELKEESRRNFGLLFESMDIKPSCAEHRKYDDKCADCIKANEDYLKISKEDKKLLKGL